MRLVKSNAHLTGVLVFVLTGIFPLSQASLLLRKPRVVWRHRANLSSRSRVKRWPTLTQSLIQLQIDLVPQTRRDQNLLRTTLPDLYFSVFISRLCSCPPCLDSWGLSAWRLEFSVLACVLSGFFFPQFKDVWMRLTGNFKLSEGVSVKGWLCNSPVTFPEYPAFTRWQLGWLQPSRHPELDKWKKMGGWNV